MAPTVIHRSSSYCRVSRGRPSLPRRCQAHHSITRPKSSCGPGVTALESKTCVELYLTPSADGGEYPADVIRQMTRSILIDGVTVSSQSLRTLHVTGDGKIRMIEQIVPSAQNVIFMPSVSWKPFCSARSNCAKPGPRRILRPALPN